jgi:MATE family multidrug resistance protein
MGIRGVALGTLTAQWGGFLLGLIIVKLKYSLATQPISEILNRNGLKRFFSINIDIFLRTLCLVAVTLWFTRAGAQQSNIILAVNTLLMQLFILFSYFMDGFAYAGEALVGKYIGAQQPQQLKACIKSLFHWGIAMAILFTLIYLIGGESFLALLSSDMHVINASATYFPWAVVIPLCGFMAFVWDGVFIGATRTRAMLYSMAIAMTIFFTLYFILTLHLGNHALWIAFLCYLVTRGIVLNYIFLK